MRTPCAGSRPVSTSQKFSLVFTPAPSGDGHVRSAGSTVVRLAGAAGVRARVLVCAESVVAAAIAATRIRIDQRMKAVCGLPVSDAIRRLDQVRRHAHAAAQLEQLEKL